MQKQSARADGDPLSAEQAAAGFAAAGSEARLAVLRALVRAGPQGLSVGEIQQRVQQPASTLAHHLRTLATGGLIEQQRHGRSVITRAAFRNIELLAAYLLHECCVDVEHNEVAAGAYAALVGARDSPGEKS